jgi:hypothetical protein
MYKDWQARLGCLPCRSKAIMAESRTPKPKSFTVFRSAAEEARMKDDEQNWDNEGGYMSCTSGRVITVRGSDKSFKVIMAHAGGETSEHWFATMREAEAFVRRNTPRPPERSTTYDREST